MELRIKNKRKGERRGISLETATIELSDATLELGQFNNGTTPGVRVSVKSATDTMTQYHIEVIGRRNIGVNEVVAAILASLRGDTSAIRNQLGA